MVGKITRYLIAFLVPMLIVMGINHHLDNDSWDVLAEGRYIVENGIYHEDVLSIHEGLHAVVQNYGFATIFYLIYSAFGVPGIYLAMLILNFVILFLLYKICMLFSNKNVKLSLTLMAVTDIILAFGFIVTRAQMVDYIVLLTLIYVLELFIKTGKNKFLVVVPILSILMINLHASTWWMLLAVLAAYMVGGIKKYKIWPLSLVFLVSVALGFLNPYGAEMLTAIFAGYGSMAGLDFVRELKPFNPLVGYNLIFFLATIAVISLYIFAKNKIKVRHLLLFFGFLFLGLTSLKGFSEVILVMFLPLAYLYKNFKFPQLFDNAKIGKAVAVWTGILVAAVAPCAMVITANGISDKPSETIAGAVDTIDKEVGDKNKKDLKVFVGYNQGGYVEYRGYPAYLDPRGEYFTKAVNKKEDILQEYIDLRNGKIKVSDFLNKYNFDFLLVEKAHEEVLFELGEGYKMIYDDEENEVRVYKKVEASGEM